MATSAEVEKLIVRLVGDATSYQKMMKEAQVHAKETGRVLEVTGKKVQALQARLLGVGKAFQTMGRNMRSMGTRMSMALTLPLSIIGGASVRAFANFDQAMIESTSIMGDLADETKTKMREVAKVLSAEVPQSATKLAESYFFLASASKSADQSMALLSKVSAFATAGAFNMATATDLLTDAQSALGMTSKDTAKDTENLVSISDELVRANTLANASVKQFAEALTSDAATASKSMGQSLETTIALLALYADKGKKGAEAGNLFGRATRLLSKAARDNANVFSKYQIKTINQATGEYRNFIDILEDMNQAFSKMTGPEVKSALSELGFEALAQKSILPLLGATNQLKKYEEELRKAGGTTADVAEKQMKSFSNQIQLVKNQLALVGIEIGEVLAPYIMKLGGWLKQAAKFWQALSPAIKKTAVAVGLAVSAIGPLLIMGGSLLSMIGFMSIGLSALIGTLTTLAGIIFSVVTSPIIVGFTTAAALVLYFSGLLHWLAGEWSWMGESVSQAMKAVKNALDADNLALAFQIMWTEVQLVWVKGLAPLEEAWIGFNMTFKNLWAETLLAMKTAWGKTHFSLARGITKLWGLFDKTLDVKGTLEVLTSDEARFNKGNKQAKNRAVQAAKDAAGNQMGEIQKEIGRLEGKRNALATQASVQAEIAKLPEAPGAPTSTGASSAGAAEALKATQAAMPSAQGAANAVQAARRGSAEAQVRVANFRDAVKGGSGGPEERTANATEQLVEIQEDALAKINANIAQTANFDAA